VANGDAEEEAADESDDEAGESGVAKVNSIKSRLQRPIASGWIEAWPALPRCSGPPTADSTCRR